MNSGRCALLGYDKPHPNSALWISTITRQKQMLVSTTVDSVFVAVTFELNIPFFFFFFRNSKYAISYYAILHCTLVISAFGKYAMKSLLF